MDAAVAREYAPAGIENVLVLSLLYPVVLAAARARAPHLSSAQRAGVKSLFAAYNAIMSLFSAACAAVAANYALTKALVAPGACADAMEGYPAYEFAVWAFYVSKYVEWVDTLYMIVKGDRLPDNDKNGWAPARVSWLHAFHHQGAPLAVGLLWYSRAEFSWIFLVLNGTVHTFMYLYYALCTLGHGKRLRCVRPLMTSMQIVQFFTGFITLYVMYIGWPCLTKPMVAAFYYQYAYVGMVLLLFLNFFVGNYISKADKKSDRKTA